MDEEQRETWNYHWYGCIIAASNGNQEEEEYRHRAGLHAATTPSNATVKIRNQ